MYDHHKFLQDKNSTKLRMENQGSDSIVWLGIEDVINDYAPPGASTRHDPSPPPPSTNI